MPTEFGRQGTQTPDSTSGEFNSLTFVITQLINRLATATPVKVIAVSNSGGLSPVGFVDIQPLVSQLDGFGNAVEHGVIHGCPYMRLQGGANAVILDPQVGDIGIAVFADKDISSVCANKGESTPGSFRRFSMSDGMYIGGILNGTPSQYVQFSTSGIKIHSPTLINLDAPDIQLNATTIECNASSSITMTAPTVAIVAATSTTVTTPTFTVNGATVLNGSITQTNTGGGSAASSLIGPLSVTGDVSAGGKSLKTHVHSGVQSGGSNTGQPV